jgi:hypothetical protein
VTHRRDRRPVTRPYGEAPNHPEVEMNNTDYDVIGGGSPGEIAAARPVAGVAS